jgi:thioredoxin-related protein
MRALRLPWFLLLTLLVALAAAAQPQPSPHAIEPPRWFTPSLLDLKDEVDDAARQGKRVMVYFGQDGCPYCKALLHGHFAPGPIADKTRRHFVAIAINIWGDAQASWLDGMPSTEKALARKLGVQFTPTLMFFDSDGRLALRLNGYLPPERFSRVLDWVIERRDRELSLAEYLEAPVGAVAPAPRASRPYLLREPTQLARRAGGKPLAVMFESPSCHACAQLHDEAFTRPSIKRLLGRFDIASLAPGTPRPLVEPDGRRSDTRAFARDLRIDLYPTLVFFDDAGREVFRFDGELRPFHVESAFDYVASGAYRREPQFQRFVQARAEQRRAAGRPVDLWR